MTFAKLPYVVSGLEVLPLVESAWVRQADETLTTIPSSCGVETAPPGGKEALSAYPNAPKPRTSTTSVPYLPCLGSFPHGVGTLEVPDETR